MAGPGLSLQSDELHPLVSLLSAFFWVILWLLTWVKALIAFVTISVPRFIYFVLSYSLTLTLNFWSFVVIFVLSAVALNYFIRFRYLNVYSELKEPPLVKPDVNELHPDVNTAEPPPAFHNYLDDFLQAVRVFGFLEKPVFHELARHLQTKRLIAGDSISMDQDRSFYCVVEGSVQVFAKSGQAVRQNGSWEEDDMNGYQLINVVGNGGTLSSLFSILSLFTEDISMTWRSDDDSDTASERDHVSMPPRSRCVMHNSDVSKLDLDDIPASNPRHSHTTSASGASESSVSTAHPFSSPRSQQTFPLRTASSQPSAFTLPEEDQPSQVHRGIVARAAEDTTLAVIPAEAFRRVTKKFPKATGHIVQVILTRFSRVTFNAAHKYLGLTTEVLRTEKAINEIACHPLPASFYEGGGLHLLRQRFYDAEIHESDAESDYFTRLPSPSTLETSIRFQSSGGLLSQEKLTESPISFRSAQTPSAARTPAPRTSASRLQVQAGDLHTSARNSDVYRSMTRSFSILNTPSIPAANKGLTTSRQSSGDEFDLREEVMSCIAKSIGLLQPPMSGIESPALPPFDPNRSPDGKFASPFGSLSLLDSVSISDSASSFTAGSTNASSYMSGLDNEVEILYFSGGSTLVKAGERNTGLYYVIEGFLDILLPVDDNKSSAAAHTKAHESDTESLLTVGPKPEQEGPNDRKLLFTVKPGGIAGYLASLCGTSSYVDIQAKTDTYVGFLSATALERLLEKRPIVLLTLAKRLISLLSPLVLQIDASLDWMQVTAGQVLWRPDDVSDSFYIVINGRLRSISEGGGKTTITGEYGQGDTVGELDVMTGSARTTTVHAIRDSELIRMPQTLFNAISSRNPQTTAQLLKMIASRIRLEVDSSSNMTSRNAPTELGKNNTNLKTVALLPVSRNVPIDVFARKLKASLENTGARTSLLNQASVSTHLGRHAFTRMGKLKAAAWLADQEQRYRIVLYVTDSPVNSQWTQTCIRQADFVMVIGMGDDPTLGEYERLLLTMKTTARKELVLLHPDRSVLPGSTREWLKSRPWIHQHIHVELPGLVVPITKLPRQIKDPGAVAAFKNLKDRVQSGIQKYRGSSRHNESHRRANKDDFARLARRLCGKSIGVVLGGGGARGLSHLGLIRALEEHEIPIDYIGGTSIGSFIGGLYARECDLIMSTSRARQFSSRMSNFWRILSDVTYPLVAYTTGHEFNRTIYKAFYDLHIEDMWLPYFCNTTNINTSSMEIHDSGYAWRFIRASMTLVGLLPPLCDNGNMLVDGGYIDNLPVATMFSKGASIVFAADVGSIDDNSPRNFGDSVSGWWLLINRWNPFSNARTVPAITEIQGRLAYVSSVRTLEEAKVARGCFYMQMPVQEYGTLQFSKIDEIEKKGYTAATQFLEGWKDEGKLPASLIGSHEGGKAETSKKGRSARRNSI